MRFCEARPGVVHRFDGTLAHLVAVAGVSKREQEEFAAILARSPSRAAA